MTFFEVLTGMAFAVFADAPVDVAVLEVGLGGAWDATNVVEAATAVVLPVGLDHVPLLGTTLAEIATEKAGIIHPGATVVLAAAGARGRGGAAAPRVEVGATVAREGLEFGVVDAHHGGRRSAAVAAGPGRPLRRRLPPAARRAPGRQRRRRARGGRGLPRRRRQGDARRRPGPRGLRPDRLARPARGGPHQPDRAARRRPQRPRHGGDGRRARPTRSPSPTSSPSSRCSATRTPRAMLEVLEPAVAQVVVTQNGSPRAMPVDDLADLAGDVFGEDRVHVEDALDDALSTAVGLADAESRVRRRRRARHRLGRHRRRGAHPAAPRLTADPPPPRAARLSAPPPCPPPSARSSS